MRAEIRKFRRNAVASREGAPWAIRVQLKTYHLNLTLLQHYRERVAWGERKIRGNAPSASSRDDRNP